jgi:hypothetical protein
MTPTRNHPGVARENGAIESAHGHLKKAIDDGLLRGSRDFDDLGDYRRFVDEVVGRRLRRNAKLLAVVRPSLVAFRAPRTTDYKEALVNVTSHSGIMPPKVFYIVPSRLIGQKLIRRLTEKDSTQSEYCRGCIHRQLRTVPGTPSLYRRLDRPCRLH